MGAADGMSSTMESMSAGPMPLWKRIRGEPYDPAERMTRPFGVRGITPLGPDSESFQYRAVSQIRTSITQGRVIGLHPYHVGAVSNNIADHDVVLVDKVLAG